MDALGEPSPVIVVAFLLGVVLVNVFGYLARRRGRVGEGFEYAVFATFAPIAVATIARLDAAVRGRCDRPPRSRSVRHGALVSASFRAIR